MKTQYSNQVNLLLSVISDAIQSPDIALKGGTAINLFLLDMPRLSVDIDLCFLPILPRDESMKKLTHEMNEISSRISRHPRLKSELKFTQDRIPKQVVVSDVSTSIKIEINMILRGAIFPMNQLDLCTSAQEKYGKFATISCLSKEDLYAGKFCAALDRQHPRDLFDVNIFFENFEFTEKLKQAFLVYLISSNRPVHEIIKPTLLDQQSAYQKEFIGMTDNSFTYEQFEETREKLICTIHKSLSEKDKNFLISIENGEPNWEFHDIAHIQTLPAVKWKLLNISKMEPQRRSDSVKQLEEKLSCKYHLPSDS